MQDSSLRILIDNGNISTRRSGATGRGSRRSNWCGHRWNCYCYLGWSGCRCPGRSWNCWSGIRRQQTPGVLLPSTILSSSSILECSASSISRSSVLRTSAKRSSLLLFPLLSRLADGQFWRSAYDSRNHKYSEVLVRSA
jgi:hypothetical protein